VVTLGVPADVAWGELSNEPGEVPSAVSRVGRALADDLVEAMAAGRYLVDGVEVSLRAHVGLVFAPWDGTDVAELVRRSSLRARSAASSGQATGVWDGDRDAMTAEDLALLSDLRLAISHDELSLAYQPQVAASTGTAVSVEALLRWNSATHGSVPPGRFIVLAERTGPIDRLRASVDRACRGGSCPSSKHETFRPPPLPSR
jgi:predicted signal transduction protein with EAL and GGDEF domain